MISVRRGVFETNSSSMHAITVPVVIKYTKEQLLKELERFKVDEKKYVINVWCKDECIDKSSFTRRAYVCHDSLNDKLIYMWGTILERHFKYFHFPRGNFRYRYTKNL